VQREANASSEASMKIPSGRTIANAFVNVYTTSDSDDEATVGMDVKLATSLSDLSP
jgi:hypothetical protein